MTAEALARAADVARSGREPEGFERLPAAPDPARMVARTRGRVERHLASGKGDVAEEVRRALEAGMRDAYMAGRASLGDRSDPDPTQEARLADLMVPALEGAERVLSSPLMAAVADARDAEAVRLARSFRAFAQRLAQMGAEEGLRRVEAAARIDATPTLPPGSEARWQVERARRRALADARLAAIRRDVRSRRGAIAVAAAASLDRAAEEGRRAVARGEGPGALGAALVRSAARSAAAAHDAVVRRARRAASNALAVPEEALATDPSDAEEAAERYVTPPGGDGGRRLRMLGAGWLGWRLLRWAAGSLAGRLTGRDDRTAAASHLGRAHVVAASGVPRSVLAWWVLGSAEHCPSCIRLSSMSPYHYAQLMASGIMPGSGHTECGGRCLCSLELETPA